MAGTRLSRHTIKIHVLLTSVILLARPTSAAQMAEPAAAELSPQVDLSKWRCKWSADENRAEPVVEVALRQLPAVSADGTTALGVHELVDDDESDHPRPIVKIAPDVLWRGKTRVVVYFVDLATNRAQAPIGLVSAPLYPPAGSSCNTLKRSYEKSIERVNRRLREGAWAPLRALVRDVPEPHRRDAGAGTTQRLTVGRASLEFRYPWLTIVWGDRRDKLKLPMKGYPGATRADEPFGYLELQSRGYNTWLTDLWLEPKNRILVMRLMNAQLSDTVLGNAFDYFYQLTAEQSAALCPDC